MRSARQISSLMGMACGLLVVGDMKCNDSAERIMELARVISEDDYRGMSRGVRTAW